VTDFDIFNLEKRKTKNEKRKTKNEKRKTKNEKMLFKLLTLNLKP